MRSEEEIKQRISELCCQKQADGITWALVDARLDALCWVIGLSEIPVHGGA